MTDKEIISIIKGLMLKIKAQNVGDSQMIGYINTVTDNINFSDAEDSGNGYIICKRLAEIIEEMKKRG